MIVMGGGILTEILVKLLVTLSKIHPINLQQKLQKKF